MKKKLIAFVIVVATINFSMVKAAEIGFRSGLLTSYTGDIEIFNGQKASLTDADSPISMFVKLEKLRISYTEYTQHASDEYSSGGVSGAGDVVIENSVLSFDYLFNFGEGEFSPYGGIGLGLFRSIVSLNVFLTDGTDYVSLGGDMRSSNAFDIGFILIGGLKIDIGNAFVGGELNYISKQIQHQKNKGGSSDPDPVDIGGIILGVTTGVKF